MSETTMQRAMGVRRELRRVRQDANLAWLRVDEACEVIERLEAERDALRRQAEQAEARVAHLTEVNDKLVEQLDRAERALDKEGETAEALSHALREIDRLAMALGRTEMEALGLRARLTAREAGE